mmetsp:Transcript_48521/g.97625  ORF Transcript_48521/g.97625 Transcript_48521/m.97625 type:complete len:459 (+) Transcript_48521:46-1422(+)
MPRFRMIMMIILGLTVLQTVRKLARRESGRDVSKLLQPYTEQLVCVPKLVNRSGLVGSPAFQKQIFRGRQAVKDQGVIMGGLIRDIGGSTRRLFSSLHSVGSAFGRYHIVIIENDSKDKTREGLRRECSGAQVTCDADSSNQCSFREKHSGVGVGGCCTCELLVFKKIQRITYFKFYFILDVSIRTYNLTFTCSSNQCQHLPDMGDTVQTTSMGIFVGSRIVRLTKVRNMLLLKIREVARRGPSVGVDFDYVLLFDGDMFTADSRGFNPATFHAMLGLEARYHYDVICGNQIVGDGMYRDVFGLRFNSFDEGPVDPAGMAPGDKLWFSGSEIVPVKSCFSGLALYTAKALLGEYTLFTGNSVSAWVEAPCAYEYENEETCEHVALHKCLARNGMGRLGIYPPMAVRMNQVRAETSFDPSVHEAFVNGEKHKRHPTLAAETCAPVQTDFYAGSTKLTTF